MGQTQCRACCSDNQGDGGELQAKPALDTNLGFRANEGMDLGLNSSASGGAPPPRQPEEDDGGSIQSPRPPAANEEQPQEVTLTYKDGSTYEGQFKGKKRHGHGLWKSLTVQYEGQFSEDKQHGTGKQSWRDGRTYVGQFSEGKFGGEGRMEWHTPSGQLVYEGQYVKDAKHGKGKLTWPDGRSYDGEWREGKREGQAIYVNAQGDTKQGTWLNDRLEKWEEEETK